MINQKLFAFGVTILTVAGTMATDSARAADPINYTKFVADRADALVVLKFVLKAGEQEIDAECAAVMIEPTGLAICSSVGVGGSRGTPTALKVLVGDDDNGVEAKLLARDSELDLAWVQVKSPPTKPYVFVDLSKAAVPAMGDTLVSLRRMVKYFDRAPAISVGQLVGMTRKPRDLLVPGGGMAMDPGAPVFTSDGRTVGFVVLQFPDPEDMRGSPRQAFGRERDFGSMILPCADVVKATERAKKAKEGEEMSAKAAERAKKEAEAEARETGMASGANTTSAPKPGPTTRPVDDDEEEEGE